MQCAKWEGAHTVSIMQVVGPPENKARGISMLNINSIPLFVWLTRAAERFDWRAYFDRRNCRTSVKMNAKNGMECRMWWLRLLTFCSARLISTCRLSFYPFPDGRPHANNNKNCTYGRSDIGRQYECLTAQPVNCIQPLGLQQRWTHTWDGWNLGESDKSCIILIISNPQIYLYTYT